MQIKSIIFSSILFLSPAALMAGSNHDHGHDHGHGHGHAHAQVSKSQAEQVALKSVAQLIKTGKIDNSWETVDVSKSEKKQFGKNTEWVVSFTNDRINDPAKQTLYVFVSLTGKYIAANYTGK